MAADGSIRAGADQVESADSDILLGLRIPHPPWPGGHTEYQRESSQEHIGQKSADVCARRDRKVIEFALRSIPQGPGYGGWVHNHVGIGEEDPLALGPAGSRVERVVFP